MAQSGMRLLGALLGAVGAGFLARGLGVSGFGWFVTTLAVVGVCGLASDLGVTQIATRLIATSPSDTLSIARAAVGARLTLAIPSMALGALVLVPQPEAARGASAVLLLAIPLQALLGYQSVLIAKRRLAPLGVATLAQSLAWSTGAAVAWMFHWRATAFAWLFVMAMLLQGLLIRRDAYKICGRRRQGRCSVRELVRASRGVGMGSLLWVGMQRSPLVMTTTLSSAAQGALLGAASRLADALYLLPTTFAGLLLPLFAERTASPPRQRRLLDAALGAGLFAGSALLSSSVFVAPLFGDLILGLHSDEFALVAVLIVASVVPFFVDCVWGSATIALGRGSLMAKSALVSLALTILIGIPMSARWGAAGAAGALLLGQTLRSALLVVGLRQDVGLASGSRWGAGVATLVASLSVAASANHFSLLGGAPSKALLGPPLCCLVCIAVAYATRLVRSDDVSRAGLAPARRRSEG